MSTIERQTHVADESVSVLVSRASRQISELVREEMQLARAEMTQKGKRFGKGGGLFGAAGMLGFLAAQALTATCIAALALVLPLWASALIITVALAIVAAVMAVAGKKQVARAGSPVPAQTIDSVKADLAEMREKAHR
ncbi:MULTISPECIES: phage holin family protein [Streptomyces]|uniref:phage holin family protein n=1 Tax=Streptomyces TaxID=1883 RepID=UPI0004BDB72E|nr:MULTISPECIES: phage holin family protein [Streptomyces]KJY19161.1 membrane protein [Streptomyces sp. NRRL S-104]KOU33283.1 membrane protein [Streptomyces sp. WM6373]KOU65324.1 membrane protein [Streptomyces sp. IGB124]KOU79187.1 membrane protein [Streptomyces sp. XY66]